VSTLHYLGLILIALLVTAALTPIVRRWSEGAGLVDEPDVRKVHAKPISRLGGVAIFAGFMSAVAVQYLGEIYLGWGGLFVETREELWGVLIGMVIIFGVGLFDDVYTLGPGMKFIGQLVAASVVVIAGLRIEFLASPLSGGLIALGLLSIPVTLIYIAGFTNVINLIDGLDGLAAGVTAIAAATFFALAAVGTQLTAAALSAALIGACLGFLRYNFHPASIFMGDSGALFLGFALAPISLLGVMKSVAAIALAVPLLIIGVPIFDTASAIVRRVRHKRPIQEADRGHIHHRLLGRGFDQRQTVLTIYAWSAALAVGAFAMKWAPAAYKYVAFVVLAILSALMAYWLGLFEVAHHHHDDAEEPPESPA
jgi:UDP-GlcNAc:undecaprenyl-phosphate GlcNAc-1-phosphate transferase